VLRFRALLGIPTDRNPWTLFCEEVLFILAFHLALIHADLVAFLPEPASLPSFDASLCGIVLQHLVGLKVSTARDGKDASKGWRTWRVKGSWIVMLGRGREGVEHESADILLVHTFGFSSRQIQAML
jgi:hypothetical protein